MNYHIRRIDPFWFAIPAVLIVLIAGIVLAAIGISMASHGAVTTLSRFFIIVGLSAAGASILALIKPVISATMEVLGLIGFSYSFFFMPDIQMAGQTLFQKIVATVLAASVYTVFIDALILIGAVVYNFFSAIWGGLRLDIEQAPEGD